MFVQPARDLQFEDNKKLSDRLGESETRFRAWKNEVSGKGMGFSFFEGFFRGKGRNYIQGD